MFLYMIFKVLDVYPDAPASLLEPSVFLETCPYWYYLGWNLPSQARLAPMITRQQIPSQMLP